MAMVGGVFASITVVLVSFAVYRQGRTYLLDLLCCALCQSCARSTVSDSVVEFVADGARYRFAVVADFDKERSRSRSYEWRSQIKTGWLYKYLNGSFAVQWEQNKFEIYSGFNDGGRGMELSDLVLFGDDLFTADDRTGIIFRIHKKNAIPWTILTDGNGYWPNGFKAEWMTQQNGRLIVGGLGKEWTNRDGEIVHLNPMWVKSIGINGDVVHLNWSEKYRMVKATIGVAESGYVLHEAVAWSSTKNRWYFLPRRVSDSPYSETTEETVGANMMVSCSAIFDDCTTVTVGVRNISRGFSSVKFLPSTRDTVLAALQTIEVRGETSSFLTIFDDRGNVFLEDFLVSFDIKYEGLEFIPIDWA